MRVSSSGQVTIPLDVMRRLGIEAGSEVEFIVSERGVRLVRAWPEDSAGIVAEMRERGRGRISLTTEELMAMTRGGHWAGEADPV